MEVLSPTLRWGLRALSCVGLMGGLAATSGALDLLRTWTAQAKEEGGGKAAVSFDLPPAAPPPTAKRPAAKKPAPSSAPKPVPSAAPAAALRAGLGGLDLGGIGPIAIADDATRASVGNAKASVMTEASVDVVPRPLQRVAPEYPVRARARGAAGSVTLSILVGADGRVRDVRVLKADPPDLFEQAASDAVRQWTFAPGEYNGAPVDVRVEQTLRFGLE
jgi:protein TonB